MPNSVYLCVKYVGDMDIFKAIASDRHNDYVQMVVYSLQSPFYMPQVDLLNIYLILIHLNAINFIALVSVACPIEFNLICFSMWIWNGTVNWKIEKLGVLWSGIWIFDFGFYAICKITKNNRKQRTKKMQKKRKCCLQANASVESYENECCRCVPYAHDPNTYKHTTIYPLATYVLT